MKVAIVEIEKKASESAIIASNNKIEEIRANSIVVGWERHHVVFHITYNKRGKVTEETIAYRAFEVVSVCISDEEE